MTQPASLRCALASSRVEAVPNRSRGDAKGQKLTKLPRNAKFKGFNWCAMHGMAIARTTCLRAWCAGKCVSVDGLREAVQEKAATPGFGDIKMNRAVLEKIAQ